MFKKLNVFRLFSVFKCGKCDEAFEKSTELQTHLRDFHTAGYNTFECYLCKKRQKKFNRAMEHMKLHSEQISCEVCKVDLTSSQLKLHVCRKNDSIKCDYCEMEFTATIDLLKHLKNAHEPKEYQCKICKESFPSNKLYDLHMEMHIKPFMCHICSNTFATKPQLIHHFNVHETTSRRGKFNAFYDLHLLFLYILFYFRISMR